MNTPIQQIVPLGAQWGPADPFLFCVYHNDAYPAGNQRMGPATSLAGRDLGQDFAGKDGWRMYHGDTVPGFPQHPHRGFETVTIVRRGLIDHSDSLGATARFGSGDVQWLTAGRGISHCEMFPLVDERADNPLEMFQIWLNLPAADKLVAPYFTMLWGTAIPHAASAGADVAVSAGALGDARALAPPPNSWAARAEADVAMWSIRIAPGARVELPPARATTNRMLYAFRGDARVNERAIAERTAVELRGGL